MNTLTPEEREKFIRLCQMAQIAIQQNQYDVAHLYFRHAVQIHPFSIKVWMTLAEIAIDEQDRRVALKNVLAIDPNHERAQTLLQQID